MFERFSRRFYKPPRVYNPPSQCGSSTKGSFIRLLAHEFHREYSEAFTSCKYRVYRCWELTAAAEWDLGLYSSSYSGVSNNRRKSCRSENTKRVWRRARERLHEWKLYYTLFLECVCYTERAERGILQFIRCRGEGYMCVRIGSRRGGVDFTWESAAAVFYALTLLLPRTASTEWSH